MALPNWIIFGWPYRQEIQFWRDNQITSSGNHPFLWQVPCIERESRTSPFKPTEETPWHQHWTHDPLCQGKLAMMAWHMGWYRDRALWSHPARMLLSCNGLKWNWAYGAASEEVTIKPGPSCRSNGFLKKVNSIVLTYRKNSCTASIDKRCTTIKHVPT